MSSRTGELLRFDDELRRSREIDVIAGFDEAGRGPLCGPVAAGGVILPAGFVCPLIDDSKKLTAKQREAAEIEIKEHALAWWVELVPPETIDRIDILEASRLGMEICLRHLQERADVQLAVTDYMKLHTDIPVLAIPHGDATSLSVAAASILAKTARDRYMDQLDARYPEYGFAKHKGYPTRAHLEVLEKLGPIPGIYRMSYRPVQRILAERQTIHLTDN